MTPPPVNEYQLEAADLVKERADPVRSAEHTKKYADACCEIGAETGVVVLDVWSIFMAEAGWKEGETLVGSKKVARNEVLEKLLSDGEFLRPKIAIVLKIGKAKINCDRIAFSSIRLSASLRFDDEPDTEGVA